MHVNRKMIAGVAAAAAIGIGSFFAVGAASATGTTSSPAAVTPAAAPAAGHVTASIDNPTYWGCTNPSTNALVGNRFYRYEGLSAPAPFNRYPGCAHWAYRSTWSSLGNGQPGPQGPTGQVGPTGPTGAQGPAGKDGVTGYKVFTSVQDFSPGGIGGAWCGAPDANSTDQGWQVVGGGAELTTADVNAGVQVVSSWPNLSDPLNPGWNVQLNKPTNVNPGNVTLYAVCVKSPTS